MSPVVPGPEHLGRRLTVRSRVPGERAPSGRPALTDVVGRLVGLDGTVAELERRDGSLARVRLADVELMTVVPDRPRRARDPRAATADDLTRLTTRGWPPLETADLGDWTLRAAGGFTGRANSVAVHGDPGVPAAQALERVVDYYRARDLPPRAQVVVGSDWERTFEAAGWGPLPGARDGAIVQVARVEEATLVDAQAPEGVEAAVDDHLDDGWAGLYGRVEDADPATVRAVLAGPRTTGFARAALDDGTLVGIGRVAVTGEWAVLGAFEVVPEHRRRGIAAALVSATVARARENGATSLYLQTMRDNVGAIALYERYGFTEHHEYRYVSPPA